MATSMRLNPGTAVHSRDERLVVEKLGQVRISTASGSPRRFASLNMGNSAE